MTHKLFVVLLLGLLLLVAALPVLGQEITPEPTPVVIVEPPSAEPVTVTTGQLFTTAIIAVAAVSTIAFVVFGYIVRPLLAGALAAMPEWGANMLLGAVDTGLDSAARYATTTETLADDDGVRQLREDVKALREEIARLRAGRSVPPTPPSG